MYSTFCFSLLFVSTIHVRASEQSLGYNGIIDSIKLVPKIQQYVHTSPNSFSKIADSIAKSFDLRSLIRIQKSSGMNEQFANATDIPLMNSTTEVPFSGSTELPVTGGVTNQSIAQSTEATSRVPVVPTTDIPPPSNPVSELCLNHIKGVIEGLTEKQQWAIKMIDATGKPPADIFGGNLIWLGDYEECLSVQASVAVNNTSYNFGGQYCLMTVPINGFKSVIVKNAAISVGLCLPDRCSTTDTQNLMNSVLSHVSNNSLTTSSVVCQEPDKPYDTRAIIVLVVIAVFICIMISGTAYDVLLVQWPKWRKNAKKSEVNGDVAVEVDEKAPLMSKKIVSRGEEEPGIMGKMLLSFSIYTNGAKILNTDQSAGSLTAINGIRFFSMTWVILGHTYAFVILLGDNILSFMPRMIKRITFGAIGNALVSVDTFFTLSGILLAYLIMKELKKKEGKLNWGMFYFHRFWRLTPPYMLVLMVYVSLFPYIGSGPIWPKDGVEPDYCEKAWYYNLLYVNNFVKDAENMCMGWSWYLANDMQFFVISPLILLPLFFFHAAGVAVLLAFLISTWVATGVMATKWNIPMSVLDGGNYMDLYFRPYFRMGPYLVGMYTGYLLYRTNFKCRMNKFVNLCGWIVATVLACLVLYGQHDHLNNGPMSAEVASLYNTVHRTVWGACVCWVVFSCANGYGGFINTFLSWKGFIPLSRLTYCAYLVHPVVIYHFQYTRQRLIHFTDTEMIYEFLGHLVITYGIAFVTSLAFESPMMGLEKVIFKRNAKKN